MAVPVGLSSASVFPEDLPAAFAMAAQAGYDGMEILVQADPQTQSATVLAELIQTHRLPVLSVHSPCLLITSTVWSTDPLVKMARSVELAEQIGAAVVVVHPPFLWQRAAAATFTEAVAELQGRTEVAIAVENMFPVTVARARVNPYRPHWDPTAAEHRHLTLDLSHTATSGSDALEMMGRMGSRLAHLHLTDGSGSPRDEHLVPGRGTQPGAEVLRQIASRNQIGDNPFPGAVVLEISTRSVDAKQRRIDVAESLAFARTHLGQ